jgi:hypothetical protein
MRVDTVAYRTRKARMKVQAAIEISSDQDPGTLQQLIASAYLRSRGGCIALMLNGVDKWAVNRVLDGVVADVGIDVQGVVYCDVSDRSALRGLARSASEVMTLTEPLHAHLWGEGISSELLPPRELLRWIRGGMETETLPRQ